MFRSLGLEIKRMLYEKGDWEKIASAIRLLKNNKAIQPEYLLVLLIINGRHTLVCK